jgi:branched-chain amino acid transport system permease protein
MIAAFLYSSFVLGSIFATMSLGLALVWGAFRMLNMAHGTLIMLGAYVAFWVTDSFGVNVLVGAVAGVAFAGAIGAAMYPLFVRPLIGRSGWDINVIVATVAFSIAGSQVVQLVFGPRTKSLPPILSGGIRPVQGIYLSYQTLIIPVMSLMCLLLMAYLLRYTRIGVTIRAVAQNLDGARIIGLPIGTTYVSVLAFGSMLAALSGVFLASDFLFLTPTMSLEPMLVALIIIILGGLGSVAGTVTAAYLAGLIESAVTVYLNAQWSLPVLFLVVIVVLMVRPAGLFGVHERLS